MIAGDETCRRQSKRLLTEKETEVVIQTVAELIVDYLRSGVSAKRGPRVERPSNRSERTPRTARAVDDCAPTI